MSFLHALMPRTQGPGHSKYCHDEGSETSHDDSNDRIEGVVSERRKPRAEQPTLHPASGDTRAVKAVAAHSSSQQNLIVQMLLG